MNENNPDQLTSSLILLNREGIQQRLKPAVSAQIKRFDVLTSIPSTNDYFRTLTPVLGLQICMAEHQSAGRGRLGGRQWQSPSTANIYLSLCWLIEQSPMEFGGLSLMIGLAVVKALTQYGVPDMQVKWPNDILWQDKKLGGILVEMQIVDADFTQIIMGLGLNINMNLSAAQAITQPWTALNQIIPTYHDRNIITSLILNQLITDLALFQSHGFAYFHPQWQQYDSLAGKILSLKVGNKMLTGIACGVNINGNLLLEDENQTMQICTSGEASILK